MPLFLYDPLYWVFLLPPLLLGLYAQYKVKTTFSKYLRVPNSRRISGVEAARTMLAASGISHVNVEGTPGRLSDHYDPRTKTLRLSREVAGSASLGGLSVVAHEVGHAVQDATNYGPMKLRTSIVPAVSLGSWLGPILFLVGLLTANPQLAIIGVIGFAGAAVFSLVTLPVELNASARALGMLQTNGLIMPQEVPAARSVLNAAALTYVAALMQSISTLLYYLLLVSGMRRD